MQDNCQFVPDFMHAMQYPNNYMSNLLPCRIITHCLDDSLALVLERHNNLTVKTMPLEGRAGAEGIRSSQQHAVEVDVVVIDPMLHRWQEAQELQAAHKVLSRQRSPAHIRANRLVYLDLP